MKRRSESGQVLVEYLLLMVISIACVTILTKALVSRKEGSEGMIIKAWDGVIKAIGNDLPDCANQTDFGRPNCPQ